MSGTITKREVIAHTRFIISRYGVRFYLACLVSRKQTFLGLLNKWGKL